MRVAILALVCTFASAAFAQAVPSEACPRGVAGDAVPQPEELRSRDGILRVDFSYRRMVDGRGLTRYCYLYNHTVQSPTLRVKPGDQLTITLRNELPAANTTAVHSPAMAASGQGCGHGPMTASSTNLHFHGLVIPPVCHQDETLKTLIQPGDPPFPYSFKIPPDQPPGLYWYHPHVHGFNQAQVLGGASGALIVEGIETVDDAVSGLPERVLVVRDQELLNPDAAPVQSDSMPAPQLLRDAEETFSTPELEGESRPRISRSILFPYRIRSISLR
jgi:FtsP/CotA-like multicopper oxidase with cupredoxin domain